MSGCRDNSGRVILGDIIVGIEDSPVLLQKDLFEKLDDCKVSLSVHYAAVLASAVTACQCWVQAHLPYGVRVCLHECIPHQCLDTRRLGR